MTETEKKFVEEAADYLKKPTFFVQLAKYLENPIEKGLAALPKKSQDVIFTATRKALEQALKTALFTIQDTQVSPISLETALTRAQKNSIQHGIATGLTGGIGGFFGMAAIAVELPLATALILRSIAKIAASFGEDLSQREVQLECLMIFSLGGGETDLGADTSYYGTRVAAAHLIRDAVSFLAARGGAEIAEILAKGSAPVLTRLIGLISSRFQLVIAEKLMAQAVPVAGAFAGSAINVAFTQHYSAVARYHFGLKTLERKYGEETVKQILKARA